MYISNKSKKIPQVKRTIFNIAGITGINSAPINDYKQIKIVNYELEPTSYHRTKTRNIADFTGGKVNENIDMENVKLSVK